jgi:hypothetical protein
VFVIGVRAADTPDVKRVVASSACAALFALVGCGGESEATASGDCLTVPQEVIGAIAAGAPEGSGFVARQGMAVLGTGGEVYFVAMRFDAAGETDMTGVWATTSITANETSSVISVDGFAKQFTVWPDAEAAFDISPAHASAGEAEDCLG